MQNKPLAARQRDRLEHLQSWNWSGKRMIEYAGERDSPVRAMYDVKKALANQGHSATITRLLYRLFRAGTNSRIFERK